MSAGGYLHPESTTLLLTGTIEVNRGVKNVTASDRGERELEYRRTIRYFLDHHPRVSRIVFAENSGADLSALEEEALVNPHAKKTEFLSFRLNDFPPSFGKGYGALALIEAALERSRLVDDARLAISIPGRHRLLNLTSILVRLPAEVRLACDLRDGWLYRRLGGGAGNYCDTRFLVFESALFLERFAPLLRAHEEGEFWIEDRFYDAVAELRSEEGIVVRWPREPDLRGVAGHWTKDYGSPKERFKRTLRAVTRRIAPMVHI